MKTVIIKDRRYSVTCNGMLDGVTSYSVTPPDRGAVDVRYIDDAPDMSRAAVYSGGQDEYRKCVEAADNYRALMRAEDDAWLTAKGLA